MKTKTKMLYRSIALILVISSLSLNSCEPPYCILCYDRHSLHWTPDLKICSDDREELKILYEEAEAKGYECDYQDND